MESGKDWPELREQLERSLERWRHIKRVLIAIIVVIFTMALMLLGIKVIGTAQEFDFYGQFWDTYRLELGLFVTLVGAILSALSLNHLIAAWKGLKAV